MVKSKIKVAIVDYLNTKPFIHGIQTSVLANEIELIETSPAQCAALFLDKSVDLSLVPVGALLHQTFERISDFAIGSDGAVSSVCIYSDVPIEDIEKVYLDYQSRTSVLLTQVLFKKYWLLNPVFVAAEIGYENKISGTTAGLVIGDRALNLIGHHPYSYDLGLAWQIYSQLPFTYAVWCSTKGLPADFIVAFNQALRDGLASIPTIVQKLQPDTLIDLATYYRDHIHYLMDERNVAGIATFLNEAGLLEQSNAPNQILATLST